MASGWCWTCGLVGEESAASWREVVASLVARHLARPVLAVIDGNPGLSSGAAGALAGHRDSTLHRAQAAEPAGEGAGAPARRADRRLPPDDLRRDGRGRGAGARAVHEEVAAALPGRGREPGGSRRRAVHVSALSPVRSGKRCGRPTRSSGSTRNSVDARRRRRACQDRTRCSSCSLACCAVGR